MSMNDLATVPLSLTAVEREQLADYEATIQRGLNTFYEVGNAFVAIKQRKLYRAENRTFEEYCREKWNITPQHAGRMIAAAEVVDHLKSEPIGSILPETESQARELNGLEPDQQRQVWQKAVETAPNGNVTAKHIKDVRQVEITIPEPTPAPVAAPVKQVSVFIPDNEPEEIIYCPLCESHPILKHKTHGKPGIFCPKCLREWSSVEIFKKFWPVETDFDGLKAYYDDINPPKRDQILIERPDQEPPEDEPATKMCMFCGERFEPGKLYTDHDNTYMAICRPCASKALHDLLDPHDPDVIRDAQTAEDDTLQHSWYSRDMDKMLRAGLRSFRACGGELLLKEYSRVIGGVGSPDYISGSWKHFERFQTKKALKERMAELEQDDHIIFENHL